uniref:Uncharacterized protein n=1 Tax=viral metagenome TaxID=1070528 RepID=A0A6C0KUJ2_9ZZZZ
MSAAEPSSRNKNNLNKSRKNRNSNRNNNSNNNNSSNNNNNRNNSNNNRSNNNRSRKRRKGIRNNGLLDTIRTIVIQLFPEINPERFEIDYEKWSDYSEISIKIRGCPEEGMHVNKWYPHAIIKLEDNELHVELLTSCDPITGTQILDRFIQIARNLRLRYVTLDDASTIYFPSSAYSNQKCGVSLAMLEILQSGQSWYQRKGFNTAWNSSHLKHNIDISLMPFNDFINLIIGNEIYSTIPARIIQNLGQNTKRLQMYKKQRHDVLRTQMDQLFAIHYPTINMSDPVTHVIFRMIEIIKLLPEENACNSSQLQILKRIVQRCQGGNYPVIKYNPNDLLLILNY